MRKLCRLDEAGERTLEMAVRKLGLSARAHDRILKVARTIADLGGEEAVSAKTPKSVHDVLGTKCSPCLGIDRDWSQRFKRIRVETNLDPAA